METTGQPGMRTKLRAVGSEKKPGKRPRGLAVARFFTRPGEDPLDAVEWELRSAKITNERGEVVQRPVDTDCRIIPPQTMFCAVRRFRANV